MKKRNERRSRKKDERTTPPKKDTIIDIFFGASIIIFISFSIVSEIFNDDNVTILVSNVYAYTLILSMLKSLFLGNPQ